MLSSGTSGVSFLISESSSYWPWWPPRLHKGRAPDDSNVYWRILLICGVAAGFYIATSQKKSRIRETKNLSTDADSSTDTPHNLIGNSPGFIPIHLVITREILS